MDFLKIGVILAALVEQVWFLVQVVIVFLIPDGKDGFACLFLLMLLSGISLINGWVVFDVGDSYLKDDLTLTTWASFTCILSTLSFPLALGALDFIQKWDASLLWMAVVLPIGIALPPVLILALMRRIYGKVSSPTNSDPPQAPAVESKQSQSRRWSGE